MEYTFNIQLHYITHEESVYQLIHSTATYTASSNSARYPLGIYSEGM